MAFTREFLRNLAKESGVELPKELEDGLINEHISARDTYAQKKLDENKPAEPVAATETEEYKTLKADFDKYKSAIENEKSTAKKNIAVRGLLKETGIPENRLDSIMRVFDSGKIELDENGEIKNRDEQKTAIKTEWADFIPVTRTEGSETSTPPVETTNGKAYTANEIELMTPEEINKNWNDIKLSLQKGN